MIENLPSVAHLRHRGEPVEWREVHRTRAVLLPPGSNVCDFFGDVYLDTEHFVARVFRSATSTENVFQRNYGTIEEAAQAVIAAAVDNGVVTVANETTVDESRCNGRIEVDDAELALLTYAARLRGESVEDYIIGRALLDARVSVSAVSSTDPVAKQLLLAVA